MSWPMVSPLRQRMIDDIRARKLGVIRCATISAVASGSPLSSNARRRRRQPTTCAGSS